MNGTSWSVESLTEAAGVASAEAGEVASLRAHVSPVSAQCCGLLLANAFSLTFPAATDGVTDFLSALADGSAAIGDNLLDTATQYRTTEEAACGHSDEIVRVMHG